MKWLNALFTLCAISCTIIGADNNKNNVTTSRNYSQLFNPHRVSDDVNMDSSKIGSCWETLLPIIEDVGFKSMLVKPPDNVTLCAGWYDKAVWEIRESGSSSWITSCSENLEIKTCWMKNLKPQTEYEVQLRLIGYEGVVRSVRQKTVNGSCWETVLPIIADVGFNSMEVDLPDNITLCASRYDEAVYEIRESGSSSWTTSCSKVIGYESCWMKHLKPETEYEVQIRLIDYEGVVRSVRQKTVNGSCWDTLPIITDVGFNSMLVKLPDNITLCASEYDEAVYEIRESGSSSWITSCSEDMDSPYCVMENLKPRTEYEVQIRPIDYEGVVRSVRQKTRDIVNGSCWENVLPIIADVGFKSMLVKLPGNVTLCAGWHDKAVWEIRESGSSSWTTSCSEFISNNKYCGIENLTPETEYEVQIRPINYEGVVRSVREKTCKLVND